MVARYVRDVEAASSSLATPTITYFPYIMDHYLPISPLRTDSDLTIVRKARSLVPLVRCPLDGEFDPPPSPPRTRICGSACTTTCRRFLFNQHYPTARPGVSYVEQWPEGWFGLDGNDSLLFLALHIHRLQHRHQNKMPLREAGLPP